ncbi:MAG TPA: ABC transporter ATP-binding protein [Candidatus Paceibacterota bacterium]|nr:ABC transporter ATP-binding protein [Candidatus Paceibacterota bacterium]
MKTLLKYILKYKRVLILALVLAAVNQIFSLLDPQLLRILVDDYASHATELPVAKFLQGVSLVLVGMVATAFISRTAKAFQDYFVNVSVQRVGTEMYSEGVSHSFSLPYAVFEDQRSGEILSKLQKARTDSQLFITNVVNVLFFSVVGVLFVIGYALYVHWLVGLVYILMIPTLGAVTYTLGRKIKEAQSRITRESNALAGSTTETLRNVELVKSLGLEEQEIGRLNDTNEKILKLELDKVKYVRRLDFVQGTLINALRTSLLLLMLWLMALGKLTLGEFFTLMFYSFFIFSPLAQFSLVATSYYEAKTSTSQLEEVLALKSAEERSGGKKIGRIESVRYDDLSFSYGAGLGDTLKRVNIEVLPGKTVAFVGPSGSGKSTLVKLLAGLYQPTGGKLLVNGIDSREIDFDDLRRRCGMVAQETQLFAGTIRENLLFVRPDATDDDCIDALRRAAALGIIERKALDGAVHGLDTRIGEGGLKLSGGERQRLAIARALLRKPDILIFDEATSSLDSITEKAITATMKEIAAERPDLLTIMIAHRLSTIIHSDVIYVLEKGMLVEHGTHAELVARDGLYNALWRQQTAADVEQSAPSGEETLIFSSPIRH